MAYEFSGNTIRRHRLAYFSVPGIEELPYSPEAQFEEESPYSPEAQFEEESPYSPEAQSEEESPSSSLLPNVVPFPIRFDYVEDLDLEQAASHPKSHLTLGQYEDCRIPVSAPLNPNMFVDFILRNFYHTMYIPEEPKFPKSNTRFVATIRTEEQERLHIVLAK